MEERYVLGIDIGGTSIKIAFFSEKGEKIVYWDIPTDVSNRGRNIPNDIAKSVQRIMNTLSIHHHQVLAAGVGIPGFVYAQRGIVISSIHLGWENYPVVSILEQYLRVPVVIDNDANLAAAGEKWQGAGYDTDDLIFFTIGTGVGSGILINGDIYHGAGGSAGEVGHMTVMAENGILCNCGKKGCLETLASAGGIVRIAADRSREDSSSPLRALLERRTLTVKDVFDLAGEGDPASLRAVDEAMKYLGIAAANTANFLHPQQVIIGGGVAEAGDILLTPLKRHFATFALERVNQATELKLAQLGNRAGVTGAAWLALGKMR